MLRLLVFSLLVFVACLTLHVLVWRIRRPATYATWVPALVVIFFGVGGVLAAGAAQQIGGGAIGPQLTWAAIMLCDGSLGLVYLLGYTLVLAGSPSLEILKRLDAAPEGLPRSALELTKPDEALTGQRIRNLSEGSLLRNENGKLSLAPRGAALARTLLFYRHLIGLPDGEGG